LFQKEIKYELKIKNDEFLVLLNRHLKIKKNNYRIGGKVTNNGFDLFYLSEFLSFSPTNLPFIDISGIFQNKYLLIKIGIGVIPIFLFIASNIIMITLYFLDKYTNMLSGNFSETLLPLLTFPFFYIFFQFIYNIERESFQTYFRKLIIEFENK